MKTKTLLSTLIFSMLLAAGCADKASGVVDENQETTKTVQDDTAGAQTTDNGEVTSEDNGQDLSGENQDQNVQDMTAAEDEVKNIYFDYDKFFIRADMQGILEENAVILSNDKNKGYKIRVAGHCDEWGSDEYNYALGLSRANSVKKALITQGFDADRITPKSLGESTPVCTEKTKDCWSKNRRVEFELLP